MDSSEHVCPACGQPVETVVKRHKTLGVWVPRWVPCPCRNPRCEAYVPEGTAPGGTAPDEEPGEAAAKKS